MTQIDPTSASNSTPVDLSATTLDDSMLEVVSLISGKKVSADSMSKMKLSEDVLYAALVYDSLKKESPSTAKTFAKEIKERFDRRTKRNDTQPLAKSIQDILANAVKDKKLTKSKMDSVIADSLGRAQMDKKKQSLSRTAKNGSIEKFLTQVSNNQGASDKAVKSFETSVKKTTFQPPASSRAQRAQLDKIVRSLTDNDKSTPVKPIENGTIPPKVETTTGTPETDKQSPIVDPTEEFTNSNAFVFRPQSHRDNKALVMLPEKYSMDTQGIQVYDMEGHLLETLEHSGLGDDGRRYFRGSRSAMEWPEEVTLKLSFSNNTELDLPLYNSHKGEVRYYT